MHVLLPHSNLYEEDGCSPLCHCSAFPPPSHVRNSLGCPARASERTKSRKGKEGKCHTDATTKTVQLSHSLLQPHSASSTPAIHRRYIPSFPFFSFQFVAHVALLYRFKLNDHSALIQQQLSSIIQHWPKQSHLGKLSALSKK